jgi:hypothetical protein
MNKKQFTFSRIQKRLKKDNNFIITDYKGKSGRAFYKQLSIKDSCEKTTTGSKRQPARVCKKKP